MHSYATQTMINNQATDSGDDISDADKLRILNRYARAASAKVDAACGQWFVPRTMTRNYDVSSINIIWNLLYLDAPLLELTAVAIDSTAQTLANYRRYLPSGNHSYEVQQLDTSGNWIEDVGAGEQIDITGVWGFRRNYSEAWVDTNDTVQDDPLSSTSITVTVNDADGYDAWDNLRFDVGRTIQVEDEIMLVRAVDTGANTLTVIRGALGTTAAEHAQSKTINVWYPDDDIVRATVLIAAFNYENRANFSRGSFDGQIAIDNVEVPEEVGQILARKKMELSRGA